jgi:hypothetical protein
MRESPARGWRVPVGKTVPVPWPPPGEERKKNPYGETARNIPGLHRPGEKKHFNYQIVAI